MKNKSNCCGAEIMLVEDIGVCIMCGTQCPISEELEARMTQHHDPILLKEEIDSNPAI